MIKMIKPTQNQKRKITKCDYSYGSQCGRRLLIDRSFPMSEKTLKMWKKCCHSQQVLSQDIVGSEQVWKESQDMRIEMNRLNSWLRLMKKKRQITGRDCLKKNRKVDPFSGSDN